MTSDKRDFTDFTKYEGKINKEKNIYEFPILYKKTKLGKIRKWQIVVRLIKNPGTERKKNKQINWNELEDEQLPMCSDYIRGQKDIPPESIGQYWSISGEINGKITRNAPSYGTLKNKGRSNERNALLSSIISARAQYLKKINDGFKDDIKNIGSAVREKNARYFPMLLERYKEKYQKIEYPCFVQPKLDGTRIIAFLNNSTDKVELYTRELKDVPGKDNIKKIFYPILKELYNNESIYIDFEFYKYGKKLQDISSSMRNENIESDEQCWIFDAFYPSAINEHTFDERNALVDEVFELLEKHKSEREKSQKRIVEIHSKHIVDGGEIPLTEDELKDVLCSDRINFIFNKEIIIDEYEKWFNKLKKTVNTTENDMLSKLFKKEVGMPSLEYAKKLKKQINNLNVHKKIKKVLISAHHNMVKVPTIYVKNRIEEEFIYWGFLTVGFEGTVVRNIDGLYRADADNKTSALRSSNVQKRKYRYSAEYPLHDFTEGEKGSNRGAIMWVFIIKGKIVKGTPKNVTIEERKKLFSKLKKNRKLFDSYYKGKLMTIEYEDLSRDGIPQRLKVLGIRPYK